MTDAPDSDKAKLLSDLSSIKNLLENPLQQGEDNIPTLREVVPNTTDFTPQPAQFTAISPRVATEKLFADANTVSQEQQLDLLQQEAVASSEAVLKQKMESYAQDLHKELMSRYLPLIEEEFQQRLSQYLLKLLKQQQG